MCVLDDGVCVCVEKKCRSIVCVWVVYAPWLRKLFLRFVRFKVSSCSGSTLHHLVSYKSIQFKLIRIYRCTAFLCVTVR